MKTIYKYILQPTGVQDLQLPMGAQILSVQGQFSKPCLWALVEPTAKKEERTILLIGTGHPISEEVTSPDAEHALKFIETFQLNDGALIFHAFEMVKNDKA